MTDMGDGLSGGSDAGHILSDSSHIVSEGVVLGPAGWPRADGPGKEPAPPSPVWFKFVPMAPFA